MGDIYIYAKHLSVQQARAIARKYGLKVDDGHIVIPERVSYDTELQRDVTLDTYAEAKYLGQIPHRFVDVVDADGYVSTYGACASSLDELRRIAQRRADERRQSVWLRAACGERTMKARDEKYTPQKGA